MSFPPFAIGRSLPPSLPSDGQGHDNRYDDYQEYDVGASSTGSWTDLADPDQALGKKDKDKKRARNADNNNEEMNNKDTGKAKGDGKGDGDEGTDPSVQDPSKKPPLRCAYCKHVTIFNKLFLLYLGDWEGSISGICRGCYEKENGPTDEETFKKLAGDTHNARKKKMGRHSGIARGVDWKAAVNDIGRRNPGKDKWEYREELKKACKAFVVLAKRAYEGMSDFDKRRFVVAYKEQDKHLQAAAKDPSFVPPRHGPMTEEQAQELEGKGKMASTDLSVQGSAAAAGSADPSAQASPPALLFWLPSHIVDWASEIVKGLDNYYLCRGSSCRYFAPNTCWGQEVKDGALRWRFSCPACGDEYAPGRSKSTWYRPNRLLVAQPPDEETAKAMGMKPGEVTLWFCEWTDTVQCTLERRLTEITLALDEKTRDWDAEKLDGFVKSKVNDTCARSYFALRHLDQGVVKKVRERSDARVWTFAHLDQGYYAAQAPEYVEGQTVVLGNDDVLLQYALVKKSLGIK